MRSLFGTTLNINGIWGGYTGEGVSCSRWRNVEVLPSVLRQLHAEQRR